MIKILDYRIPGVKHNSDSRLYDHQEKWIAQQRHRYNGDEYYKRRVKETVAIDLAKLLNENPRIEGVVIFQVDETYDTYIKTYENLGDS
jgi:hypothetical protein